MEDLDFSEKVDKYLEQTCAWNLEGERGIKTLTGLVKVLGYNDAWGDNLKEFFADNSGALEAVIDWIREQDVQEWDENLGAVLVPNDDEEEDDEE